MMEDSKKNHVATGLLRDDHSFRWKIENFNIIKENQLLTASQFFIVKAGILSKSPSEWHIYLIMNNVDGQDWIGVGHQLIHPKLEADGIISSEFAIKINNLEGNTLFRDMKSGPVTNATILNEGYDLRKVIKKNCHLHQIPLENNCLTVDVQLTVFTQKLDDVKMFEFEITSACTLIKRIESMYRNIDDEHSDMKILTNDNKEFFVHKNILAGCSPVFKAMFHPEMMEARTGVIRVEDISWQIMDIMLYYIYSGKLYQDGLSSADNVIELAYAAEKYELLDLHKICDDILAQKWDTGKASKSMKMADVLRLENTKSTIAQFMEESQRK